MSESVLQPSPLDSARFGRRVYRAALRTIDAPALADELRRQRVDTLILRVPAEAVGGVATLHEVGLHPIVADTHVEYEVSLDMAAIAPSSIALCEVAAGDSEALRAVARSVFDGYSSHYNANPLLPAAAIADGYADWAARFSHAPQTPTWFVKSRGEIAGFSCCRVDGDQARGVLNGILPAARGAGHYRAMLHAMLERFRAANLRTFVIATQVHNIAVQRVWAEAGLRLKHAENTIHVNCDFGGLSA
ncbi:GNAT family N-acetyltransferase [Dokdonella ginsengisoli]|uniref:GNAT family N-acetyltransferase n=1 Tax=Dokdonella ginsengisoli TaxID=363846 RepID=A0ABV9QVU2_9GAMM